MSAADIGIASGFGKSTGFLFMVMTAKLESRKIY